MIVRRFWQKQVKSRVSSDKWEIWDGWFLFGILPLYVRKRKESRTRSTEISQFSNQ